MPLGPSQDLRRLVLAVERQPGRDGADFGRLKGHVDDPVGGLHLEHIARLELVRRDVHRPAVDLKVPVRDELARLLARRAQAEPVDDVVHAQLEVAEQVQAGDARLARRLVEIVAELLLEQPVDAPRLLLGAQLQAVVGRLALAAACANDLLLSHYLPAFTFFLPATARLGPRRLRALVRVRWPRTGSPRRCRMPRYEPISVRRLMLLATSRRRSPSMSSSLAPAILSMIWRRRVTSSSLRSFTRVSGLTPAVFTSF